MTVLRITPSPRPASPRPPVPLLPVTPSPRHTPSPVFFLPLPVLTEDFCSDRQEIAAVLIRRTLFLRHSRGIIIAPLARVPSRQMVLNQI